MLIKLSDYQKMRLDSILNHSFNYGHCCYGKGRFGLMQCWTIWLISYAQTNRINFFLSFRNQVCATNSKLFKKVVEEMNERAAADVRKNGITD